jgi:hypothetical protein
MADTDNLFSRVPFPPKAGIKTNNYISARTLALDFKIPWNFLVETNAAAEKTEAKTALNTIWWCLLEKVRTHFQKNPDL